MNIEELEEALSDILESSSFSVETDSHGQVIIYTGLSLDDNGELVDFEPPDEDSDFELLEDEGDNDE